ncbi:DegQ family serine endoprotease [Pseudothauera nasutitermitis]|uniref:Probable periplasmic serine endoprotease DegP-like n=1 Tax=Pseudothauera nasutitermitis TaxID=2565930 RepID=A0A4S4B0Y5_9RHOO|nr:DegQ family serine endoprotease [Pseudothauera nasutitermitis]THF64538.1 DegQ family serine endoprotease [Pseudothauera nasutitermitis]
MRKFFAATSFILALATGAASGPVISAAHAEATAPSAVQVSPNRYGLPDFGDLVEQVGPAVVNISVVQRSSAQSDNPFANDPFYDFLRRFGVPGLPNQPGGSGPRISRGIGSGFIVSADGYVLTNAHVVGEGESEVTVRLIDKREFRAKVVGTDARTDIALLKIDATALPAVRIGNAENARVGEWVVAMGSPFGFDNTVTAGIISAKARRLPDENYVPFIQTDVAINPGNSGGPLFNLAGEVVGINSQIYSRSGGFMGISFAIPIDVAMNIKDQLIEHGRVQRGRLGVTIQGLDTELAQSFGLDKARGALVSNVEPGSPAEQAGIRTGDVVLGVDGAEVQDSADLPRIIGEKRPGTRVRLQLWRDGRTRDVTAVLGEMGGETLAQGDPQSQQGEDAGGRLGLAARALSPQEARQLDVPGGLVVENASGPAAQAGLQPGDVILALNNQAVRSVDQFRQLLSRAGNRFALLVQRGDARMFVPVRIGN